MYNVLFCCLCAHDVLDKIFVPAPNCIFTYTNKLNFDHFEGQLPFFVHVYSIIMFYFVSILQLINSQLQIQFKSVDQ